MTQEEIIEGNKLIAEFMDYKHHGPEYDRDEHYWHTEGKVTCEGVLSGNWFFEDAPPFHKSFSWLIPVVEEVESLGFKTSIEKTFCSGSNSISKIYGTSKECHFVNERSTKIESVWLTVVDFIKWHNEHGR